MSAHLFLTEAMARCEPSKPCSQASQCARVVCVSNKTACVVDGSVVSAGGPCPMFIDERAWRIRSISMEDNVSHYPQSPYGNPPLHTSRIYDAIFEAGEKGMTYQQISEKTGVPLKHVGGFITNLCGKGVCNRRVMVYRLPVFDKIRLCFAAEVPREVAEKTAQEAAEPYLAASKRRRKARNARAQRGYMEGKRADPAYLQALAEREAAKEAKRAEKEAIREKARKDAADRKALEAQQRAQRLELRKTLKSEAAMNNRLAQKMRGTSRGIVQAEKKPEPTITWPEVVQIQRAPRPLGRYEVLDAPGPFSSTKPGQYAFPANSCAAKAAA